MATLGVGIIGLHHLHSVDYIPHFEAIEQTEVLGIAEADKVYLDRVCAETGIKGHSDFRELLDRDDIHLVAIFLPHNECPDAVEAAAASGKHVIVEKPMANTSEGIERMIAATDKAGVVLSPPYCWRAHPASRQIKRLVDRGILGDLVTLKGRLSAGSPARYDLDGISPWLNVNAQAGGGPMHNLGVHWIDLFRWLLDDEVESAVGMMSNLQHNLDIEDNSFGIIRFEGGATATLDISYSVPSGYPAGRDLFISLRGTLGTVSWSPAWGGIADEVVVVSDHAEFVDGPVTTLRIGSREVPGYGGICGLAYLRELAEAIVEGRTPEISGTDGLRALQVAEAIYESADLGSRVKLR